MSVLHFIWVRTLSIMRFPLFSTALPNINKMFIFQLWHEMKLEKESTTKQSTTSVIDFEERLSSVGKDSELPGESALETLTIKQKIQMFSRESEKNERNKGPISPPQPMKPQIRINSEPFFDGRTISEASKVNEKNSALHKISTLPNDKKISFESIAPVDRRLSSESATFDDRKSTHEKYQKSENDLQTNVTNGDEKIKSYKCESLFPEQYYKNEAAFHEQFQKSETFCHDKNLFQQEKQNNVDQYPNEKVHKADPFFHVNIKEKNLDQLGDNEEHGKVVETINRHLLMNKLSDDSDVVEYPCYKPKQPDCSSNSLPHHGRVRVDKYEKKTTHSLPTRGKGECDSELSKTISKVITEDRERMSSNRSKSSKTKEHKPLTKSSQSIFYSKSYSSESLDKSCEGRQRPDSELAYKYNSLEDRHLRREGGGELRTSGPPVPPPRPSLSKPSNACYRAAIIAAHHLIGKASPKAHRKKHPLLSSELCSYLSDSHSHCVNCCAKN